MKQLEEERISFERLLEEKDQLFSKFKQRQNEKQDELQSRLSLVEQDLERSEKENYTLKNDIKDKKVTSLIFFLVLLKFVSAVFLRSFLLYCGSFLLFSLSLFSLLGNISKKCQRN
jgi:hypothetical protein